MKLKTPLFLLALVALALLWIPTVTASNPLVSSQEEVFQQTLAAPACSAIPTFDEAPIFLPFVVRAADGCGSQCDASCRAQGYDYGVCIVSTCICRVYLP